MREYDDLVEEGKAVAKEFSKYQTKLGELADEVSTEYGEETLAKYAEDIDVNFHTLRNCRTVYRKWKGKVVKPENFATAKALASHPDREYIIRRYPDMTERQALELVRRWRERKSTSKYNDAVIHKLIERLGKRLNKVLADNSEERRLIQEIASYENVDYEYVYKAIDFLMSLRKRVDNAIDELNASGAPPKEKTNIALKMIGKSK